MSEVEHECLREWIQAAMRYYREVADRAQIAHSWWFSAWMNGPGSGLPAHVQRPWKR